MSQVSPLESELDTRVYSIKVREAKKQAKQVEQLYEKKLRELNSTKKSI